MEKTCASCVLNTGAQTHRAKPASDFTSRVNRRSRTRREKRGSAGLPSSLGHSAAATGQLHTQGDTDTGSLKQADPSPAFSPHRLLSPRREAESREGFLRGLGALPVPAIICLLHLNLRQNVAERCGDQVGVGDSCHSKGTACTVCISPGRTRLGAEPSREPGCPSRSGLSNVSLR